LARKATSQRDAERERKPLARPPAVRLPIALAAAFLVSGAAGLSMANPTRLDRLIEGFRQYGRPASVYEQVRQTLPRATR